MVCYSFGVIPLFSYLNVTVTLGPQDFSSGVFFGQVNNMLEAQTMKGLYIKIVTSSVLISDTLPHFLLFSLLLPVV